MRVGRLLCTLGACCARWAPVVHVVFHAMGACYAQLCRDRKSSVTTGTLPSTGQPCRGLEFPCRDRSPLGLAKTLSRLKTICRDKKILPLANSLSRHEKLYHNRGPSPWPISVAIRKSCRNTNPFPQATLCRNPGLLYRDTVTTENQKRCRNKKTRLRPSPRSKPENSIATRRKLCHDIEPRSSIVTQKSMSRP